MILLLRFGRVSNERVGTKASKFVTT